MSKPQRMAPSMLDKLRRAIKKPPLYIARRALAELKGGAERHLAPIRAARFTASGLAHECGCASVEEWWAHIAARPYVAHVRLTREDVESLCPGDYNRI